jgi:hypothetical protein
MWLRAVRVLIELDATARAFGAVRESSPTERRTDKSTASTEQKAFRRRHAATDLFRPAIDGNIASQQVCLSVSRARVCRKKKAPACRGLPSAKAVSTT